MFDYLYPGCCFYSHYCATVSYILRELFDKRQLGLNMYLCFQKKLFMSTHMSCYNGWTGSYHKPETESKKEKVIAFLSYIAMDKSVITLNGLEDKDRWKCVNIKHVDIK